MKVQFNNRPADQITFADLSTGSVFSLPTTMEGVLMKIPTILWHGEKANVVNLFSGNPCNHIQDYVVVAPRRHTLVIED
jgi:hypothetical protein